jgi:hypothetical protein
VFKNRVVRKIFGHETAVVTGETEKITREASELVLFSKYYEN